MIARTRLKAYVVGGLRNLGWLSEFFEVVGWVKRGEAVRVPGSCDVVVLVTSYLDHGQQDAVRRQWSGRTCFTNHKKSHGVRAIERFLGRA